MLSRGELLQFLYPGGEAVIDRVIDVDIGKLSQRTERDSSIPFFILTVRGVGYWFADRDTQQVQRGQARRILCCGSWSGFPPLSLAAIATGQIAIDYLAADYFMVSMKNYGIDPTDSHGMFVESIHSYLIWASPAAVGLGVVLSYILKRQ